MKIDIQKLYEYIFSDRADVDKYALGSLAGMKKKSVVPSKVAEIKSAITATEPVKSKESKKQPELSIDELKNIKINRLKKEITDFFFGDDKKDEKAPSQRGLIKKTERGAFQQALTAIGSGHLKSVLFSSESDETLQTTRGYRGYIFPSDEEIRKKFYSYIPRLKLIDTEDKETLNELANSFIQFFKVAKIIGDFIEKSNDIHNRAAYGHAYAGLIVFGQDKSHPLTPLNQYLKEKLDSEHPFHDALTTYSLPYGSKKIDLEGWRVFIQRKGPAAFRYFNNAVAIEKVLDGKAPGTPTEALDAAIRSANFIHRKLDPELADLCVEYDKGEAVFNKCLEIRFPPGFVGKKEKTELKGVEKEKKERGKEKEKDNLPNEIIDGKLLAATHHQPSLSNYYFVKLPLGDPRAYLLGAFVICCQSIGGLGEQCVIDGITLENNGFYVLLKRKNGIELAASPFVEGTSNTKINYHAFEIVGEGYAWLSKYGNLTFDSWENRTPTRDDIIIDVFLKEFGRIITHKPDASILRVTIGKGGKTPELFLDIEGAKEEMLEGTNYGDADSQSIIYCNEVKRVGYIWELSALLDNIIDEKKSGLIPGLKSEIINWVARNCHSKTFFDEMKFF